MVNYIWGLFLIIGVVYSLINGNAGELNNNILEGTKNALNLVMQLLPIICLWLGLMKIAEKSGLLSKIANKITPFLKFIFPDIPKGHESFGLIASNIIANMAGLGNAATPFGLKTMKSLNELNQKKDTASRSMITFLVLNTVCITMVPTTIIALRMLHGSKNPSEIALLCFITSSIACFFGLMIDRFFSQITRKNK